jgi:phosphatidylserine/phosphatidylglycerophosphate/cardiolipin synthase-like enzyme
VSAIEKLGDLLSAEEAGRIGAELRQRRLAHLAAKRAYPAHRAEVKRLLGELLADHGDVLRAAALLDGIAAVPRVAQPELVWTSPRVPGAEGRTTLAALDLINSAEKTVFAATYSAGRFSPHLMALANAGGRGVAVTVVVDTKQRSDHAEIIRRTLPAARMWTLTEPEDGSWAIQHAKLVAVDDRCARVTSANFSEAAARRSLECGLQSTDPAIARGLREHLERLHQNGVLVDY